MPLYREGGEAIGRLLNHHPEREPQIWALVAGAEIWKRWHLLAFKSIWRLENPVEYQAIKDARKIKARRNQRWTRKLEESREAAKAAMPSKPKTSERPEEPQT